MTKPDPETDEARPSGFARLEDVLLDEAFPSLDLALRRGRHIDRDDLEEYALLSDAGPHLENWYRRYDCELVHKSDGYFYLLPTSDRLGRRHLSAGEMVVGQALALLLLDPRIVEEGGVVSRELVLEHLAGVVGVDALVRTFNPKRKRVDERVAAEIVRTKVGEAIRRLSLLGFVELRDGGGVRLRTALLRFADPVRGTESPAAALERLVASGEAVFAEAEDAMDTDAQPSEDDEHDADEEPEDAEVEDDADA